MKQCTDRSCRPVGLLLAGLLACCAANATGNEPPIQRYLYQKDGVQIEITAPRADVMRVRVGREHLPEDASWAVLSAARAPRGTLGIAENATATIIDSGALVLRLDHASLSVSVMDRNGRDLLLSAPGQELVFDGAGFRMRLAMRADAHYFGLGDKTGSLDRRDGSFTLWNTDHYAYGPASDPLYKSIPFFIEVNEKGESTGFFLDNHWRTNFDFGKAERDTLVVSAEGGPVDYYVMAGPTPKDVVMQYAALTGAPPLMPLWALGFQQSHWSYMSQAEVEGIADHLRADRIPADVLYTDIDYQDRNRPFTINTQSFPDFPGMVAKLRTQGLHLVMITDLHVPKAPDQGYAPYDSGTAADIFVKNPDGSVYSGPVWPGPAVFPDFSRAAARQWWGEQYRDFVKMGVIGFWNDMNEPAVFKVRSKTMPLDVVHGIEEPGFTTRKASHAEMHNVYGMLNTQATYEGLRRLAPDQRPFVLTRASFAGGQRYAATWTGDNLSSWVHLKLSLSMLVNMGLSGFAYVGADIGGFAGERPSPELLTRWIEVGAFNPIFRDHYSYGKPAQEVWVDGAEHEAIRRHYIEERYRLMPYVYGLAEESSRSGLPMMRPVFLEFPAVLGGGDSFGGSQDQFMLGADLLVALSPTPESMASYDIKLPGDGWFDYWTGQRIEGSKVVETPSLARLPVYVRPGAILPKQPLVQSTADIPQGPLTLAVYPGPDCRGTLYLDDGVSFGYARGGYLRQAFSCQQTGAELVVSIAARQGSYRPWWTQFNLEVHGIKGDAIAEFKGKRLTTRFDKDSNSVVIELPDVARAASVRIRL
jgi:alpha-glucosidase